MTCVREVAISNKATYEKRAELMNFHEWVKQTTPKYCESDLRELYHQEASAWKVAQDHIFDNAWPFE